MVGGQNDASGEIIKLYFTMQDMVQSTFNFIVNQQLPTSSFQFYLPRFNVSCIAAYYKQFGVDPLSTTVNVYPGDGWLGNFMVDNI